MEVVKVGESVTLDITEPGTVAAHWIPIPEGLVELAPAGDGRSCSAKGIAAGSVTVKATDSARQGVGYFSVQVMPAAAPAPAPAEPVAAG